MVQNVDNNKTTDIPLWNIYYWVGQSYRFKEDFKNASWYLKKSVESPHTIYITCMCVFIYVHQARWLYIYCTI